MSIEEAIITNVVQQSVDCERGVLAIREDGRAGFALMGPNCVFFTWNFMEIPQPETFFDLCLN